MRAMPDSRRSRAGRARRDISVMRDSRKPGLLTYRLVTPLPKGVVRAYVAALDMPHDG